MRWDQIEKLVKRGKVSANWKDDNEKGRMILKYIYNLKAESLFQSKDKFEIFQEKNCGKKINNPRTISYCGLKDANINMDNETFYTLSDLWENFDETRKAYESYKKSQNDVEQLKKIQEKKDNFELIYKIPNEIEAAYKKAKDDCKEAEKASENINVATLKTASNAAKKELKEAEQKQEEIEKKIKEFGTIPDGTEIAKLKDEIKLNEKELSELNNENKQEEELKTFLKQHFVFNNNNQPTGCQDSNNTSQCAYISASKYTTQVAESTKKWKNELEDKKNKLKRKIDENKETCDEKEKNKDNLELQKKGLDLDKAEKDKAVESKKADYEKKQDEVGSALALQKNAEKNFEEQKKIMNTVKDNYQKLKEYYENPKQTDLEKLQKEMEVSLNDVDSAYKEATKLKKSTQNLQHNLTSELDLSDQDERNKMYAKLVKLSDIKSKDIGTSKKIGDHLMLLHLVKKPEAKVGTLLSKVFTAKQSFTAENSSFAPFRIYKYSWSPNTQEEDFAAVLKRKQKKSKFKNLRY